MGRLTGDEFIYSSARLYYPLTARALERPEAMTHAKAQRLTELIGRQLTLSVQSTPYPNQHYVLEEVEPYSSGEVTLTDALWHWRREATTGDPADGLFELVLKSADQHFMELLVDRRDVDYPNHRSAHKRGLIHWGSQNWGGLTFSFWHEGEHLYTCDSDVFAPSDSRSLSGVLHYYVLSMDPDMYNREFGPSREPEPGQAKPPESSPPAVPHTTVRVGKCLTCGAPLELEEFMLAAMGKQMGFVIISCGNGHSSSVRVLADPDSRRTGFRFQLMPKVDPP